jgi:hypothetical protein
LTAINTWRARDHGVPGFNTLRQMFGLTAYNSFSELTDDPQIASALSSVYGTVEDCDIYVCGLAESIFMYLFSPTNRKTTRSKRRTYFQSDHQDPI